MTAAITVVVLYTLAMLCCWAICADSKRRETYTLTQLGERVAAQLGDATVVDTYDAREGVYVRATRHPCGAVDVRVYDPATVADALADEIDDALRGGAA